jgi:GntR family transcriptional regulator, transcriptional repressor for pyruvate dehydrogenase complex
MRARGRPPRPARHADGSTAHVVAFVRALIDRGRVRPGDRLSTERKLAVQIGVSRATVRAGLRALAATGIVRSRQGSGTFISEAPALASEPLGLLAALHGFTGEQMYEARRVLEVGAAGLAAERATPEQVASMADEVASLFERMDDPLRFLNHDITFHRIIAEASANPIISTLVETVSALYYDRRRRTAEQASNRDLIDAAEAHRRIYQAIRARDAEGARRAMHEHLLQAAAYQAQEAVEHPAPRRSRKRSRRTAV